MAQKRMFSPDIVGSDAFIEMAPSTQALYFHLGMRADDDGFVNPKIIMRMIGSQEDELKVLIAKKFVLPFDNGVLVIKHWRINNFVRKDRYKETLYTKEKQLLLVRDNQAYTFTNDERSLPISQVPWKNEAELRSLQSGQPVVNQWSTQDRIGKDRIGKDTNTVRFAHPKLQEVTEYCKERGNSVDPEKWFSYYESNGWKVGRNAMKDWKAAVRTWEKSQFSSNSKHINNVLKTNNSNAIVEAMKKKIQKNEK